MILTPPAYRAWVTNSHTGLSPHRRKQKENQEEALRKANDNTLKALKASEGGGHAAQGRKVGDPARCLLHACK